MGTVSGCWGFCPRGPRTHPRPLVQCSGEELALGIGSALPGSGPEGAESLCLMLGGGQGMGEPGPLRGSQPSLQGMGVCFRRIHICSALSANTDTCTSTDTLCSVLPPRQAPPSPLPSHWGVCSLCSMGPGVDASSFLDFACFP